MTATATRRSSGGYLERPAPSGLADVIEIILDKGMVIDVFVRVSLIGIEVLTIDARIVIASVDTYLRFAEATNRLDLYQHGGKGLDEMVGSMSEKGASGKTKGALSGAADKAKDWLRGGDDEDEQGDGGDDGGRARRPSRARSSAPRRRRREDDEE